MYQATPKQHWGSIHEKDKAEAELKKSVAYKKQRVINSTKSYQ